MNIPGLLKSLVSCWLCAAAILPAPSSAAANPAQALLQLRATDLVLAQAAYRLAVANAPLCAEHMPASGLVIHAADQYAPGVRDAAREILGLATPVAVEAVVPGSPGEEAGIRAGDGILAIDGSPVPQSSSSAQSSASRDAAEHRLLALPVGKPISFELARSGKRFTVSVLPRRACRARFEVLWNTSAEAHTDGEIIQIGHRFAQSGTESDLAVVLAHEFAHVILRHRVRLEAAEVSKGLFAGLGRSGRLNRQAELEADQLSAHLLFNAGWDPRMAVHFWQKPENRSAIVALTGHPSPKARAAAIAAEIAALPKSGYSYVPAVLARRNEPMH